MKMPKANYSELAQEVQDLKDAVGEIDENYTDLNGDDYDAIRKLANYLLWMLNQE